MSKKQLIIILAVIFSIFITAFIFVMCNRKPKAPPIVPDKYAADNYEGYHPPTEPTTQATDESGNAVIESYTYMTTTYNGLNYLTAEQKVDAVKINLFELITASASNYYKRSPIVSVDILSTSDNETTYVTVHYEDGTDADFVVSYDCYTMHDYMRCVDAEYNDYINSGANGG